MTAAADFIDAALQYESSEQRAEEDRARHGGGVRFYGASVGAVRGTIRDAERRYPGMAHDEITALSSELWAIAAWESRLAAIVLLQSHVDLLVVTDLTRLEGFVRTAGLDALVDPLVVDVIRPLLGSLDGRDRARAGVVLRRWSIDGSEPLRRAAELAAIQARAGEGSARIPFWEQGRIPPTRA